jgi:hypothetical protein
MVKGSREEIWIAVHLVPKAKEYRLDPEFVRPSDFSDSDEWIYYGPYCSTDQAEKSLGERGWYTTSDTSWGAERRRGFFMVAKIIILPVHRRGNRLPQDFVKKAENLAKEKRRN